MENIIVIGSGLGGWNLVREIRKNNPSIQIQVITQDGGEIYPKPQLSAALSKGSEPDQLIQQSAEKWSETLQVELFTHTRVVEINKEAKWIRTHDGRELPYGKLVLATGAKPIILPIQGSGASKILRVNHLDDYRKFRTELVGKKRVAIIGTGLIGVEFAHDLSSVGIEVDLIGLDAWPLGALLPQELGTELQSKLEARNIHFHLSNSVQEVEEVANGLKITLKNGEVLEVDLLLSAVGLIPDTELAKNAGLAVGRGIQVNRQLQTLDPSIYALGDGAEIEGLNLPFIMPLMSSAKILGQVLTGSEASLSLAAMPVVIKTPAWPVVVSPDFQRREGSWQIEQTETGSKAEKYDTTGKLIAFALTGEMVSHRNSLLAQLDGVLT